MYKLQQVLKELAVKQKKQTEIKIPLQVGDVILTGRFRNKRVSVKSIGVDEYGCPTVNGNSILKFRIEKLMPTK